MATFLLILHGLVAIALIGSITHQAAAACWPAKSAGGFVSSFRAVSGARYTTATIVLYILSVVLGGLIYPAYRLAVRPYLETARLWTANGSFELKEQWVAIGLGLLPLYWLAWRQPLADKMRTTRMVVTGTLCFIVWYSFIVGHVLNNIRGLYGR